MDNFLKDQNKLPLFSVMATNVVLFYFVLQNNAFLVGDWTSIVSDLKKILPAGFGVCLIGIINSQLSSEAKSRIIWFRWNNSLPACEAFTKHAKSDPRVNVDFLEASFGPLPADPQKQNKLWYKLFKTIESDSAVTQAHRAFLFSRDYAVFSLMLIIGLGSTGLFHIQSEGMAFTYLGILLIQFILTIRAARSNGKQFVSTVLALKGAGR